MRCEEYGGVVMREQQSYSCYFKCSPCLVSVLKAKSAYHGYRYYSVPTLSDMHSFGFGLFFFMPLEVNRGVVFCSSLWD